MRAIRSTNPLSSNPQPIGQLQTTHPQQRNAPKPGTLILSVIERLQVTIAESKDPRKPENTPKSFIVAKYLPVKPEHQEIFNIRWKKVAQEIQAFLKEHCKNAKNGYVDISHGKASFMGFFNDKQPVYGIVTVESGEFDGYFHRGLPHLLGRCTSGDMKIHARFVDGEPNGYCMTAFGDVCYDRGWVYVQGKVPPETTPRQNAFFLSQESQATLQGIFEQVTKLEDGPVVLACPTACFKGDLKNGEPKKGYICFEDFNYSGEFAKRAAHGNGALDCPYASYSGHFKQWKAHGFGTHVSEDGIQYAGNWKDGMRNGEGTSYDPNGDEYTGEWKDNKRHGWGRLSLKDGKVYEGAWENDKLNGQGRYQFPDGKSYNGLFKDGKRHGYGIAVNENGDRYMGVWENDKTHGYGAMMYFKGIRYAGDWVEGIATGEGTCIYVSGDTYEGGIKEGLRHGTGTYTSVSGDRYEGTWVSNLRHGNGKMFSSNGVFEGTWKNDVREALGTFRYTNGDVYHGYWVDGMKQGVGTLIYRNNNFCTGTWVNDKMEGLGLFVRVGKEQLHTFKCMWKDTMYAGGGYEITTTPRTGNLEADLDKATLGFPFVV